MIPIIIGAGRGSRLKSLTDEQPKCFARVGERRILDWILDSFSKAGFESPVFIGGYRIEDIRSEYPGLVYYHNREWERNNILVSLMHAEPHMGGGFICSYSDILFRDSIVRRVVDHPADIVLCVDTDWRDRYTNRLQHPENDAEKVTVDGDRVTRIHRDIESGVAAGEYIGVAKFSKTGAAMLAKHYHRVKEEFAGKPWREAERFEKAYLIQLLQDMIEQDSGVHMVSTNGDYLEIDTEEDYRYANANWLDDPPATER